MLQLLTINKKNESDLVVGLAGNPNVGKSTVFNALTGLNQHTGNWPGKTVVSATGYFEQAGQGYTMVDLPGCYSLMVNSTEEEAARDFICFQHPDAVVVICDATCLERNLNLALQVQELTPHVVVCVNLMDEAAKKKIEIDLQGIEAKFGIPIIGVTARSNKGLEQIHTAVDRAIKSETKPVVRYPSFIEQGIDVLSEKLQSLSTQNLNTRWLAARLLDANTNFYHSLTAFLGYDLREQTEVKQVLHELFAQWQSLGHSKTDIADMMAACFVVKAEELCKNHVKYRNENYSSHDRKLDKLFTSKITGFPIMIAVLLIALWLTISGANVPSEMLANLLFGLEEKLANLLLRIGAPTLIVDVLVHNVYNVLAWVVSVMLPPMAIFFPLFTLLEDFGYLPRVAFNLDRFFKRCDACGKQALTMCMGFGCNAAGVVGCRIIDSPRERLIAIITNNFVICNGRFPTILSIIAIFMVGSAAGLAGSMISAGILTLVVILGVIMTVISSKMLSRTVLQGIPSSFTLELPSYRRPQVGRVIVRSLFDRTLKVLGRAIICAAPAGLIIWILNTITVNNLSLLMHFVNFLQPMGALMGLDGAILAAFILGIPANEIVVPIMIMIYMATGNLLELDSMEEFRALLLSHGWTIKTAISMILFSALHWPCATTLFTIQKESQSTKWTVLSFLLPTACGILFCILFNLIMKLFGM
ncbi:ferrous iron transport protein B [Treponema phagedenis]|uniref:ferrous iron transport protein B n=1 Tax=Treponema phagedenis TaxID=162 RepID=UPI0001F6423F|nr:ferrous iron transport protein B [Treponema phagedenis]EFW39241.1 ferrous iron transport protein B [Treponema phagedenis F0421]TYT78100.1 ferrous iron transport protein B [Treponema phagedenis]